MMLLSLTLFAVAAALPATTKQKGQVLKCFVETEEQANTYAKLEVDTWTHHVSVGKNLQVLVKNEQEKSAVEKIFGTCSVEIPDVSSYIEETRDWMNLDDSASSRVVADDTEFFKAYQKYEAIISKLQSWASSNPELVTYSVIGKSVEGRDIPVLKMTNSNVSDSSKKAIFFNAGIHAREWLAYSTNLYLISKLLSESGTNPTVQSWLKTTQNPDGYSWTYNPGGYRFWRKNRRVNRDGSIGVDLNRNFDEHWGQFGTSSSPSSDVYHGTSPFSEPETRSVSDFILSIPNKIAGIDIHTMDQSILRSWGWTKTNSKNENILKKLGDGMAAEIKNNSGFVYRSEKSASLLASGCEDDWMTAKALINGWTLELRGPSFNVPPSNIVPAGEEIFAAITYFINFNLNNVIPPNV
ncbi:hypothetical protein HK099_002870 [Clydaea vesicula]|uniref:Peptidase M14 domain-containing protein n=1 Tax=Clydaea vesicula TaxID=447962 RepID=A0AAD5XZJ2_9FUNG|nr:hypothetical protein HK099_002870 [Clydaea vesicula]